MQVGGVNKIFTALHQTRYRHAGDSLFWIAHCCGGHHVVVFSGGAAGIADASLQAT